MIASFRTTITAWKPPTFRLPAPLAPFVLGAFFTRDIPTDAAWLALAGRIVALALIPLLPAIGHRGSRAGA